VSYSLKRLFPGTFQTELEAFPNSVYYPYNEISTVRLFLTTPKKFLSKPTYIIPEKSIGLKLFTTRTSVGKPGLRGYS
jgi:hypothetical protein